MSDEAFLQAILERPDDDSLRLVYSDWLEEHGQPQRAELIRTCEAMRRVPVFSDEYWRLKARRNQLRQCNPADWLAATGYDGSRYDPLYRHSIPSDWRGQWRLIREFTERWHGIPMGDVGGRQDAVRAEERRLGRKLPPSVREYIAYAHDVASPGRPEVLFRDVYTLEAMEEHQALSVMMIAEGNVQWAIRYADLRRPDPPVYTYHWPLDDYTRYVPAERDGPEDRTLTDFVCSFVSGYKPEGGHFGTQVRDAGGLRKQMDAAFPIRVAGRGGGTTYEGNGILAKLRLARHGSGLDLEVCVHESATWERVPSFLWEHARHAPSRGGMFLSEQDRREAREHWGDPLPPWLGPTPPPLLDPAGSQPRVSAPAAPAPLPNPPPGQAPKDQAEDIPF